MVHYVDILGRLPPPINGPRLGPRPRIDGGVSFVGQGMPGASPQLLHRRVPRGRRLLSRAPFLNKIEREDGRHGSGLHFAFEPCLSISLYATLPLSLSPSPLFVCMLIILPCAKHSSVSPNYAHTRSK